MSPCRLLTALAAVLVIAIAVGLACGDGGGTGSLAPSGSLTDPRTVPTATPWTEPPDVIFLEEGAIAPLPGETTDGEAGGEPGVCGETYVVESGDSPSSIAQKCGVDVDELMRLNDITDPTSLQVGQELKLPR